MGYLPLADRAAVLHAYPLHFIEAAKILERLLANLTAYPVGQRIMLHGHVPLPLMDELAAWGAELDDIEVDSDLEPDVDGEPQEHVS